MSSAELASQLFHPSRAGLLPSDDESSITCELNGSGLWFRQIMMNFTVGLVAALVSFAYTLVCSHAWANLASFSSLPRTHTRTRARTHAQPLSRPHCAAHESSPHPLLNLVITHSRKRLWFCLLSAAVLVLIVWWKVSKRSLRLVHCQHGKSALAPEPAVTSHAPMHRLLDHTLR
eukprot:5330032-Pleurochrysis_carterae.AAC.2